MSFILDNFIKKKFQFHIISRNGWCDLQCKSDNDCANGRVCYVNNPEQPRTCVTACSDDSHCNHNQECFYFFKACVEKCSKVGCPAGWKCLSTWKYLQAVWKGMPAYGETCFLHPCKMLPFVIHISILLFSFHFHKIFSRSMCKNMHLTGRMPYIIFLQNKHGQGPR